jgi:hypothetical protein
LCTPSSLEYLATCPLYICGKKKERERAGMKEVMRDGS